MARETAQSFNKGSDSNKSDLVSVKVSKKREKRSLKDPVQQEK